METRFTKKVRVDPKQLEWLKENKHKHGCRTSAGFLDKIINHYKQYGMGMPQGTGEGCKPRVHSSKVTIQKEEKVETKNSEDIKQRRLQEISQGEKMERKKKEVLANT